MKSCDNKKFDKFVSNQIKMKLCYVCFDINVI